MYDECISVNVSVSVCLRRNGLVGGYIYSLILGLVFVVGFPFREWDENFINCFFFLGQEVVRILSRVLPNFR